MNREEIFKREINYINDENLKQALVYYINNIPEYILHEGASSTGKYHPDYATGDGGLLRHLKASVRIGKELLDNPLIGNKYTKHQKDMMLFGLLIHDGLKRGLTEERYTRFDHPILMANFVLEHQKEAGLNEEDAQFISEVIRTHMGPYTRDYNGDEILEIPKTKYQSFVHMCDYLASRKFLEIRFDENNNIIF